MEKRCVSDGAQQCPREQGHGSAMAPTLQPQHSASTAGTPGLLRASHKPGPAALHSSRVGPWGAVTTSCQQPHGAPCPHSSQRTGMCPGLVRARGSAFRTVWFCSQCHPCFSTPLHEGGSSSSICLCVDMQGSRGPGEHGLLPILPTQKVGQRPTTKEVSSGEEPIKRILQQNWRYFLFNNYLLGEF